MKKRKLVSYVLITFLLVTVTVCGTVMAYMFKKTEYMDNRLIPAQVTCEVKEVFESGTNQKKSITVENTGNIPAYIRVRLITYWVKDVGEGKVEITGRASEMPDISTATGWVPGSNNTYYYRTPVAPGDFTQELLAKPIILAKDGDYLQVVEVFAEAIQSTPGDAVTSAWPITLNSDGYIATAN